MGYGMSGSVTLVSLGKVGTVSVYAAEGLTESYNRHSINAGPRDNVSCIPPTTWPGTGHSLTEWLRCKLSTGRVHG
jgi:hypothetical protein